MIGILRQLLAAILSLSIAIPPGAASYVYDAVGNRTQKTSTIPGYPGGLTNYNANDQISTDTYDNDGNTTASNGVGYVYDFENRLVQAGSGISIVYDGDGNRVSKTVAGVTTNYLVDDQNPTGYAQVVYARPAGRSAQIYVYGLELISEEVGNTTAYYVYDGHGSVRALTNTTGTVTDTYDYDAFGNVLHTTGTTCNNYLFAGEQFDPDLGLYYNRARYLNVSTGRFWSMDSFEGAPIDPLSLHRYLYAEGDPTNNLDPSGHETLEDALFTATVVTTLANITTTAIALHAAADQNFIPDWGIVSFAVTGGANGGLGEFGVDVLFNAHEVNFFIVPAIGISPLTLFNKFNLAAGYRKVGTSVLFGAVFGVPRAEEYQEYEAVATWPLSIVDLLGPAVFHKPKCWGALTQLAKNEHNVELSDLALRFGFGSSGSGVIQIGLRSNDFS